MPPNRPDPYQLWSAASYGQAERCNSLLKIYHNEAGYIDYVDPSSQTTALVSALKNSGRGRNTQRYKPNPFNYLSVVEVLLKYGAKIENHPHPPAALHYAIENGDSIEYMQLLIDSPQNIDLNIRFGGNTPLMTALGNLWNSRELAKEQMLALLLHGADVHALDENGNSILHQRCSDDEWVCKTLEQFGVDFNRKCRYGRTPLHSFIYEEAGYIPYRPPGDHGSDEVVQMFLSHGSDVYILDDTGRTVIETAEALLPPNHLALKLLQSIDMMTTFAMGTHKSNAMRFHKNNKICLLNNLPEEIVRKMLQPEHQ
jgi:ankyrin repeat protein